MATPPKVGARNDLNALRDARRHHGTAVSKTERALNELRHMQERVGRPDYSVIAPLLGELALDLAKVKRHLDEMWTLREAAGMVVDDELAGRLAAVEAQLAELLTREDV